MMYMTAVSYTHLQDEVLTPVSKTALPAFASWSVNETADIYEPVSYTHLHCRSTNGMNLFHLSFSEGSSSVASLFPRAAYLDPHNNESAPLFPLFCALRVFIYIIQKCRHTTYIYDCLLYTSTTVDDMFEDYVFPQENGSHYNCQYASVRCV